MTARPLFVFGTLRGGGPNHYLLAGRYARVLPATLPGFERIAPLMIARREGAAVDGELYFLDAARYDESLRRCDALEGIPPGRTIGPAYRRLAVTVHTEEGPYEAWAYVHPEL